MNARATTTLQACLAEAEGLARAWMPTWIDQLVAELYQRETAASHGHEKHGLGQARTGLITHKDLLIQRFLQALSSGLVREATPEQMAPAARRLNTLSFDDLELMDDQQVQQTVNLTRLQQVVKLAAADDLAAFSARLSRAQGLDVMRVDANPLRPEAVITALMQGLDTLHVSDLVRAHWLNIGALLLGKVLADFYRQLDDWLDRHGVAPAGYSVIQTPESRGVLGSAFGQPPTDSQPVNALTGRDPLLTLDHLHQLLVGNLKQAGTTVSDQGASGSGNAMVRTLAAEVVTQLIRRIAEDQRLLSPVRELVMGLKEPLLLLARTDPRFFADRENPARQLLDTITARSLVFTSEQDLGYEPFAGHILTTVRALQVPGPKLPERFREAQRRFSEATEAVTRHSKTLAMKTLVQVEQRNLLAEQVALEFQARNDFARAPGLVRRFLTQTWAQVVAQARLSLEDGEQAAKSNHDARRFTDLLPDLLWSSQLALASRNRPRLIKLIPKVLRTLREGLDSIDYPRAQAEAFFHALMGLHEAAYKTHHSAEASGAAASADTAVGDPPTSTGDEPWLRSGEARDSGYMAPEQLEQRPDFSDTEPLTSDWLSITGLVAPAVADGLSVGAWVDLAESGRTLRCQLTWASPHGRIFLFAAPQGRSISLSRSGLKRLHAEGRLRVVARHGVVDDALDALVQGARENSARA